MKQLTQDCAPLHKQAKRNVHDFKRLLNIRGVQQGYCGPDLLLGDCPICRSSVAILMLEAA